MLKNAQIKQLSTQNNIGIVKMENIVVPSVKTTALSESPLKVSANVDARPAVGTANAMKNARLKPL